jgi:predicted Fe-Mo cluster-binding NifX family protein
MLKIAFPTDDGDTISAHFGRAQYFMVVTLAEPEAPKFEKRSKEFHGDGEPKHHGHEHDHNPMFAPIADCQVLIAGGMGEPAYRHATDAGLKVMLTGEKTIEAALEAYRSGMLVSDVRRVHAHT